MLGLQLHSNRRQVEYFNLTITSCPPGLKLLSSEVEDEYECRCNNNNDQNIVDCLPNQRRVILEVLKTSPLSCTFVFTFKIDALR